jgi:hypothetical protein
MMTGERDGDGLSDFRRNPKFGALNEDAYRDLAKAVAAAKG